MDVVARNIFTCFATIMMALNPIKISPVARLPYDTIRGSFAKRIQLADEITDKYFEEICTLFKPDKLSVNAQVLAKKAEEFLVPIKIRPMTKSFKAYNSLTESYEKTIYSVSEDSVTVTGYEIRIPLKDNEISFKNIGVFMHEFRHVVDNCVMPKTVMREFSDVVCQDKQLKYNCVDSFYELYERKIYKPYRLGLFSKLYLNRRLNNVMKGMTDKQKVDGLQFIRYFLMSERKAYSKERHYKSAMYRKLGYDSFQLSDEFILFAFDFDNKIAFINKKLRKLINDIRKNR